MHAPAPLDTQTRRGGGAVSARRVVVLVVLGALVAAFFLLGGPEWLRLDTLQRYREALLGLVERHYLLALAAAMLVYVAVTALSIPGATVLTLAIGLLFGRWVGTAAVVIAATAGAVLAFLAARYLFADAVWKRLGTRGQQVAKGFGANAFSYLLFLRLVPLFPFWLVNLVPAFTTTPLRTFAAATAIGILPGSFVYANLGQSLGDVRDARNLVSGEVVVALALLGVLSLLPVVIRRIRRRSTSTLDPE